ncbi:MAG: hypothetical protein ACKOJF_05170, partial [Planctomycetaceae bacterium]
PAAWGPPFALAALLLVWAFVSLIFPLYDTDFWWHLRTGEWIWSEGRIPQVDLYTFTNSESPWIDLHWGFQLLMAGLYGAGGANAVILFKAVVLTLAIGLALAGPWRSDRGAVIVCCFVPAVICISGRGFERPEMLSLLGLATWLYVVYRCDRQPALVWLLPVVQVLWINCHSLFVLGLVVGVCACVDFAGRALMGGRWGIAAVTEWEWEQFRPRAQVGALCLAAALVNPYFEEGALFPLTVYRKFTVEQPFYSLVVGEFLQPWQFVAGFGWRALGNLYFVAELSLAGLAILSVATRWWQGRGVSLFGLALLIAFGHLGWEANRNTSLFALVAATVVASNLVAQPGPDTSGGGGRSRGRTARPVAASMPADVSTVTAMTASPQPGPQGWTRGEFAIAALLCGLIGLVVSGLWNRLGEGNKPFGLGEARDWYIHDAARFAGQEGMPEIALVGDFGQAAVFVYHNGPERKVFMDGRLEVCSAATLEALLRILQEMARGRSDWQKKFVEQGLPLPTVLLDTRSSFLAIRGMLGRSDWRLVHADPTAAVFLPVKKAEELKLPARDSRELRDQLQPLWERADGAFEQRRRHIGR